MAVRLRNAYYASRGGDYYKAFEEIDLCKILAPDYFEVYRTEAFVAYESGDVSRANNAYEAALDMENNQPQLQFWYAGFLTRALNMYEKANSYYGSALELDPDRPEIIRETIRNYFFQYKFEPAQILVNKLKSLGLKDYKDRTINSDIEAQLYVRWSEFCIRNNEYSKAVDYLQELLKCLESVDLKLVDRSYLEHVSKVSPVLNAVRRSNHSFDVDIINQIESQISSIGSKVASPVGSDDDLRIGSRQIGYLKSEGLQEKYGFIRDSKGMDTFVHSSEVEDNVWVAMCGGAEVHFDVVGAMDGKLRATNLRLA